MTQSLSDPNYYEATVTYDTYAGEIINYKYAYITSNGTTWENDPNKTYTITLDDINNGSAFAERTFNDLDVNTITNYSANILFQVDVTSAVSSVTGSAFPSVDNVVVAGANAPLSMANRWMARCGCKSCTLLKR